MRQTTISKTWKHTKPERHWTVTVSITADDLNEGEESLLETVFDAAESLGEYMENRPEVGRKVKG
jgi:hypothetical protein